MALAGTICEPATSASLEATLSFAGGCEPTFCWLEGLAGFILLPFGLAGFT